ncbi:MAG TPA: EamA family transporter [Leptolyngbyaceae cyanobacterium M33_DOE_097]|uniref:EamA family transporter n=1 Tax=Oscillatoriales cyanobacterium SpSt-418 TaxID=2282169 RepID=A0A7C3PFG8_9CYAN|nr:EamA family transporter [Leptolyngbyaceae cyanobacterium M33_DOE_097]
MKTASVRRSDVLLTALAPIAWGSTYIVATELLPANHPMLVAALRALPIGALITLWFRQLPHGIWWWRMLVLGCLNIGIFQALLFVAAYRLPGGVAATAGAVQPLLVVLFSWLAFGEKPSKRAVVAAIAGFVGVGLLVLSPAARLDGVGVAAAIIGAASMGLGTILTKRWKRPAPLLVFTAWQLMVGGILLLPIALIVEGPFTQLTHTNLLGFLYLGLIGTGLAYAIWFRGIDKLTASAVSYLGLLSPVVAALIGFVVLNQTFTPVQLVGVAIVLTSVFIGQQTRQSSRHLPAHPQTLLRK